VSWQVKSELYNTFEPNHKNHFEPYLNLALLGKGLRPDHDSSVNVNSKRLGAGLGFQSSCTYIKLFTFFNVVLHTRRGTSHKEKEKCNKVKIHSAAHPFHPLMGCPRYMRLNLTLSFLSINSSLTIRATSYIIFYSLESG
jgi:hypothetical protein